MANSSYAAGNFANKEVTISGVQSINTEIFGYNC